MILNVKQVVTRTFLSIFFILVVYLGLFVFTNFGWRASDAALDLVRGYDRPSLEQMANLGVPDLEDIKYENFNFNKYTYASPDFSEYVRNRIPIGTTEEVVEDLLVRQGKANKRQFLNSDATKTALYLYSSLNSFIVSIPNFVPHNGWQVSVVYGTDNKVVKVTGTGAP